MGRVGRGQAREVGRGCDFRLIIAAWVRSPGNCRQCKCCRFLWELRTETSQTCSLGSRAASLHSSGCSSGLRSSGMLEASSNMMAHTHFVSRPKGRVHLNRRGRQFNRLLAAEVCASAVVMLDKPCSEVV